MHPCLVMLLMMGEGISPIAANSSSGPCSDVDWEEWRARRRTWYSRPPATSTPPGGDGSASRDAFVSSNPWQSQADPCGACASRDDDRVGGSDKISVPEFSGEDDKDGMVTRGYLRKVAAWRRMTRLRPNKQALALYNSLTGRAWSDAEEPDLALGLMFSRSGFPRSI